jgi:ABC-type Mn2+/Zn2+ transport system ATPase subunit
LIHGQNGSGKSTLLKSITGQVLSKSGSLIINVMNSSKNLEDRIQFLSQNSGISSKSLHANIDLGSNLTQLELDEAYNILGKLHYKFSNIQKVLKGSGGEIQKVFISRILCKNADIFLLDEPTNHLDKKSYKELAEIIIDKSRHSLILVSSHDDEFISLLPIKISFLI